MNWVADTFDRIMGRPTQQEREAAQQARQNAQEAAQEPQRTEQAERRPEPLQRVQTPENERGPVPRLLNTLDLDQPRQSVTTRDQLAPGQSHPEQKPDQVQEATRLEYTRTPQPAPSIGGPGVTFVNPRAQQQPAQRYTSEIAQERQEAENRQQLEPRHDWSKDLLAEAKRRVEQMTPEERLERERGNTRAGRTLTRH